MRNFDITIFNLLSTHALIVHIDHFKASLNPPTCNFWLFFSSTKTYAVSTMGHSGLNRTISVRGYSEFLTQMDIGMGESFSGLILNSGFRG